MLKPDTIGGRIIESSSGPCPTYRYIRIRPVPRPMITYAVPNTYYTGLVVREYIAPHAPSLATPHATSCVALHAPSLATLYAPSLATPHATSLAAPHAARARQRCGAGAAPLEALRHVTYGRVGARVEVRIRGGCRQDLVCSWPLTARPPYRPDPGASEGTGATCCRAHTGHSV